MGNDMRIMLVALFLPLTAFASVFGMNLPSGLESSSSALFWVVLFGGLTLGLVLRMSLSSRGAAAGPAV